MQNAGLEWDDIRCAYFDEEDYYSFKPTWELLTKSIELNKDESVEESYESAKCAPEKKPLKSHFEKRYTPTGTPTLKRKRSENGSWSKRIVTFSGPSSQKGDCR